MNVEEHNKLIGYFDFQEMYNLLVKKSSFLPIVEVGVYAGKSLIYLVDRLEQSGLNNVVIGVDTYNYFSIETVKENFRKCEVSLSNIIFLPIKSPEACRCFGDKEVGSVYIDGDHSYAAVRDDLSNWYDKVYSGGILAGHDYFDKDYPGVKQAVDEFALNRNLTTKFLGMSYYFEVE